MTAGRHDDAARFAGSCRRSMAGYLTAEGEGERNRLRTGPGPIRREGAAMSHAPW